MGNFRSIEEVERMARIVSDMEKSNLIDKGSLYNECAAMEDVYHDVYLEIIGKRSDDILKKDLGVARTY